MKTLIFGNTGFVGKHLEKYLLELNEEDVYGASLRQGNDIRNYEDVRRVIQVVQPDYIYNLAALSYVGESQLDPHRAVETHITGTINILEAVRRLGIKTKILLTSTSEEYGYENQKTFVTEESNTLPTTIYGTTKNAMTNIAQMYTKNYGLHVVITRAFNHIGAGQTAQTVVPSFAKQIVRIEKGKQDVLIHGNLESVRNYTNVADIVAAYKKVIDAEPGIYNVCSDDNVTIQHILDLLVQNAKCTIETEVDEKLYRPDNLVFHIPSYEKIKHAVGWTPRIVLENSVKEVLDYWRKEDI